MMSTVPASTGYTRSTTTSGRVLTMDTLNPNVRAMEYAVNGPVFARAAEIEKELAKVTTMEKIEITIRLRYNYDPPASIRRDSTRAKNEHVNLS